MTPSISIGPKDSIIMGQYCSSTYMYSAITGGYKPHIFQVGHRKYRLLVFIIRPLASASVTETKICFTCTNIINISADFLVLSFLI